MDFDFSEDQEQLRDAVRKWVDKGYDFERRRAIVGAGGFDRAAYTELAELGLAGLYTSEDHGGMGMGPVEAMVVMEELGRGIVLEPLTQTLISSAVLQTHAGADLQAAWLPRIASGEALVVLAHQERGARHHLDRCKAQASEAGGQVALFLVERGAAGVKTEGYLTQDGARAAEVSFANSPAQLITQSGQTALEQAADIGSACVCAEGVGVMDKTLAITAEYMNTRKQFNVPIATFQALRHRIADMKMQLELARSMSYYASLKLKAPEAERRQAMARARYQLGNAMRFVGQSSVQLHGGIGVTDEYIVSHYFKKLTQLEMTFGDTLHHLGEVSSRMQDTAGVFA